MTRDLLSDLDLTGDGLDALAATLDASMVPRGLRGRLLSSITEVGLLAPFADRVAAMFDVDEERALELLRHADEPDRWIATGPGVAVQMTARGEGLGAAMAMLLKVESGHCFPHHTHMGREQGLVLRGACVEDSGHRLDVGDAFEHDPGTAHSFDVPEDCDHVLLAVVSRGVALT